MEERKKSLSVPPPPSPGLSVHRSPSKRAMIMLRPKTERKEKEEDFEVGLRNSAMEFDAMDADRSHSLEFDEFSKLVREREVGIFSEDMLRQRFEAISDGDGHVTFHSCANRPPIASAHRQRPSPAHRPPIARPLPAHRPRIPRPSPAHRAGSRRTLGLYKSRAAPKHARNAHARRSRHRPHREP